MGAEATPVSVLAVPSLCSRVSKTEKSRRFGRLGPWHPSFSPPIPIQREHLPSPWEPVPREPVLGAPSLSGNSLPSACLLLSSERRLPAGPGDWEPGRLGPRLDRPRLSSLFATRCRLRLFTFPSLRLSSGSRTPGSQRSPPPFPGGDSQLRVTGAWPLPPSLPAGERHSPPPLRAGQRRRRASARGDAQRGRDYLPLFHTPCTHRLDLEPAALG